VTIEVPPVRERGDDVLLLAAHFLTELAPRIGRAPSRLSDAAAAALRAYAWPGNVRQVRNEIEHALLFANGPVIEPGDLRVRPAAAPSHADADTELTAMESAERTLVAKALEQSGGNIQAAAQMLGVSRGTLYRKIERYGLPRPTK
jgi:DNA-binding NtrC family response regulator